MSRRVGADHLFKASSGQSAQDFHQGRSDLYRPRKLGRIPCLYAVLRIIVSLVVDTNAGSLVFALMAGVARARDGTSCFVNAFS